MSVLWLYIIVSQLVSISCNNTCPAKNNFRSEEVVHHSAIIVSDSVAVYLSYPHRIINQGLSCESVSVNTIVKKKGLRNFYPYQACINKKVYSNITRVLPGNPLVCHHWNCRIQV